MEPTEEELYADAVALRKQLEAVLDDHRRDVVLSALAYLLVKNTYNSPVFDIDYMVEVVRETYDKFVAEVEDRLQ